ncbi:17445_t:CDS:2, partial [Racocetra persica]
RKKSQHISKVRATACKSQLADSQSLNATIQAMIMKDKLELRAEKRQQLKSIHKQNLEQENFKDDE